MTLLQAQLEFNLATMDLERQFLMAGLGFRLAQCHRSDEQAAINALKFEGREALCAVLEHTGDARFHALALTIRNNGKADGIFYSVHCDFLGKDYDLFKKDEGGKYVYLAKTEDHQPFGEWWEKRHPLARWGGRFRDRDGNHYSFEWNGRK